MEDDAEAPPLTSDEGAFDEPGAVVVVLVVVWSSWDRTCPPAPMPWTALTTFWDNVARVLSRTRTRSLSSLFSLSRSALADVDAVVAVGLADDVAGVEPARRAAFSCSSCVTRSRSSWNSALRRSRLTWAAMRLRSARASLRSSEDWKSVRGRLREEDWEPEPLEEAGEGAETGEAAT